MRRELIEAAKDYRYLLDRGYPHKLALNTVSTRYLLSKRERLLLYRCIHSSNYVRLILSKTSIPPKNTEIVIDGYNLFSTIFSIISGDEVYLCDDGFIRDLLSLHTRVALAVNRDTISKIISLIEWFIHSHKTYIVLDANVSHSGELASRLRELLPSANIIVAKKADVKVLELSMGRWTITSDAVVLERAHKVYDLAGHIARKYYPKRIIVLPIYPI